MDKIIEIIARIFGRTNGRRRDFEAVTSGWQAFSNLISERMDKALDRIDRLEVMNDEIYKRLLECERERVLWTNLQERVEIIEESVEDDKHDEQ